MTPVVEVEENDDDEDEGPGQTLSALSVKPQTNRKTVWVR
jgi:hypothetical protein